MLITVRHIKDQNIKRKELVYATAWYGDMLMGKRLCNNIMLEISFLKLSSDIGSCNTLDDKYKPREFEIFLSRGMTRRDILMTLAHEMVHVKQFARRELANFDTRNHPVYMGKKLPIKDMHYYDYPWEIEAYGRSVGLLERYKNHIVKNKLFKKVEDNDELP